MNDIHPEDTRIWQYIESSFKNLLDQYGYGEVRFPIVEKTALFKRTIGEVTDIVEKEMYTLLDRNDESLALRPEGTAGCVRSLIEAGKANGQSQHKLWYTGPMFRYERPQKGRQRQFHQIGVETFGIAAAEMDVELLLITARLWKLLGINHAVTLELNSIGTIQERAEYKKALVAYLEDKFDQLDQDSQKRLQTNPLRILDSKDSNTQTLLDNAPDLAQYLGDETLAHFNRVQTLLKAAGIAFVVNPRLVRGLDYYNYTVFEWTTNRLGAQGTVCAGGRYDNLVQQLGGKPTPAVGFAMGVERLALLIQEVAADSIENLDIKPDVYIVAVGEEAQMQAMVLGESIRDAISGIRISFNTAGGSFKNQMKKVDKSGAEIALMIGEDEIAAGGASLKWLRDREKPQTLVSTEELITLLTQLKNTV